MWCQIISSSSQTPKMDILPSDNYRPVTIFKPCPEVVIISDNYCNANRGGIITLVMLHWDFAPKQ